MGIKRREDRGNLWWLNIDTSRVKEDRDRASCSIPIKTSLRHLIKAFRKSFLPRILLITVRVNKQMQMLFNKINKNNPALPKTNKQQIKTIDPSRTTS